MTAHAYIFVGFGDDRAPRRYGRENVATTEGGEGIGTTLSIEVSYDEWRARAGEQRCSMHPRLTPCVRTR